MRRLGVGAGALLLLILGACRPSRESVTAGQIGCAPSDIEITGESTDGGFGRSATTWFASCQGRNFVCSELDSTSTASSNGVVAQATSSSVSCHEQVSDTAATAAKAAPAAAPAAPKTDAPAGGAGFTLGSDASATQQVCEAAGNTWQGNGKAQGTCSGPGVSLGFSADVTVKFCSQKACIITIRHLPESDWTNAVSELKGKLTTKYGPPSETDATVPAGCRTEAEFADCLTNQNVRLRFAWAWPTGERVTLSVGKPDSGGDAAIRIDYTKPVRKIAANASAL